jgi:hypothetical protein
LLAFSQKCRVEWHVALLQIVNAPHDLKLLRKQTHIKGRHVQCILEVKDLISRVASHLGLT